MSRSDHSLVTVLREERFHRRGRRQAPAAAINTARNDDDSSASASDDEETDTDPSDEDCDDDEDSEAALTRLHRFCWAICCCCCRSSCFSSRQCRSCACCCCCRSKLKSAHHVDSDEANKEDDVSVTRLEVLVARLTAFRTALRDRLEFAEYGKRLASILHHQRGGLRHEKLYSVA